jgi:hypothetical protein
MLWPRCWARSRARCSPHKAVRLGSVRRCTLRSRCALPGRLVRLRGAAPRPVLPPRRLALAPRGRRLPPPGQSRRRPPAEAAACKPRSLGITPPDGREASWPCTLAGALWTVWPGRRGSMWLHTAGAREHVLTRLQQLQHRLGTEERQVGPAAAATIAVAHRHADRPAIQTAAALRRRGRPHIHPQLPQPAFAGCASTAAHPLLRLLLLHLLLFRLMPRPVQARPPAASTPARAACSS